MKKYKFGVLGAGNMGTAIAEGAVRAGRFAPEQVLMFNRSEEKRAAHAAKGYAVTGDYTEVYAESEIVLLAVKPQNFDEILPNLAKYEGEKPLVVSIAAGVTFAKLEGALGADTAMIRVMPNTPLMLGEGATQLVKNAAATDKQLSSVNCSTPWALPSRLSRRTCSTRSFRMPVRLRRTCMPTRTRLCRAQSSTASTRTTR